jgi:hypothetical protein
MSASQQVLIVVALMAWSMPAAAQRETRTSKPVVACVNWAAWREFGQASLTARGARMSDLCPIRIPAKTGVVVVDEDAGAGASTIRHRGKSWFVDAQALD